MQPELQDIVDEASKVLGADTTLEDRAFNLVAYGTQRFDVDPVRAASILQRRSSRGVRDWFEQFGIAASTAPLRTPADPGLGVRSRICFPIRWRGVTYGYLWALDESTPLEAPAVERAAQLAEHAARYLADVSGQRAEDAQAVGELVSADLDRVRQAVDRLTERGRVGVGRVAAVVLRAGGAESPLPCAPNLWGLPRRVLAQPGTDTTTLAVPLSAGGEEAVREVADLALALSGRELPAGWGGRLVAGVGESVAGWHELRASWLQARLAAHVALRVPGAGPRARWAELGLHRALAPLATSELAPLVVDPAVRRLLDGDRELVETVRVYLDHAGSVQATAAALHIHRQTLYYRLAKAEALTGLRFADGQDRTRLHLGLLLAPLLP